MDLEKACEKYLHCRCDDNEDIAEQLGTEWDNVATGVDEDRLTCGEEKMSKENAKAFFDPKSQTMIELCKYAAVRAIELKAELAEMQKEKQEEIDEYTAWVDRFSGKPVMVDYHEASEKFAVDFSTEIEYLTKRAWGEKCTRINGKALMSEADAKAFF